jgi:hypothetical protein
MLQVTRKLQCSYPKDRIYALSGFLTVDSSLDDFRFDFHFQESTRSVYQKFARKVIWRMQTLDLLSAVQHDPHKPKLKMTWVPKWDICTVDTLGPLGSKYQKYTACQGLTPPLIKWTGNWDQFLCASGIEFDSIVEATRVMAGSTDPRDMTTVLVEVLNRLFSETSAYRYCDLT